MIVDWQFYAFAIPAVVLFGMGKGGLGGVFTLAAVPLITLGTNTVTAVAVLLPILCVMDIIVVHKYWKYWDYHTCKPIFAGIVVGSIFGFWFWGSVDEQLLLLVIGSIAIVFATNFLIGVEPQLPRRYNHIFGVICSTIAGFASFIIHAGAAPLTIYLNTLKLSPIKFMATFTMAFALSNYGKLIPYYMLDMLSTKYLLTALVLMPLAPIGVGLGFYFLKKFNVKIFQTYIAVTLLIIGAKLVYDGCIGW